MRQIEATGSDAARCKRTFFSARHAAAAAFFMSISSGCSSPTNATTDSVEFVCTVSGVNLLGSGSTDASVCATFKQHIDEIMPRATKAVRSASGADWIKIDVRFVKPASIIAVLTRKDGNGQRVHPDIAVDVMDKPLGIKEVNMLAAEVAKLVSNKV